MCCVLLHFIHSVSPYAKKCLHMALKRLYRCLIITQIHVLSSVSYHKSWRATPLQAWTGSYGSKRLKQAEFLRQAAKEGGKAVSHSAVRIKSMKNPNDPIRNWTHNLPACSAVPQTAAPPHTPSYHEAIHTRSWIKISLHTYHMYSFMYLWKFACKLVFTDYISKLKFFKPTWHLDKFNEGFVKCTLADNMVLSVPLTIADVSQRKSNKMQRCIKVLFHIYTKYTVASCWIFFVNYTMMHGSTNIK